MTLLLIGQSRDFDKSLVISLDDMVGNMLFNRCQPVFEKIMATELFWLDDYQMLYHGHNVIDFSDLPNSVFMEVYDLIDKLENFKNHQNDIKAIMQSDPRYEQS